VVSVHNFGLHGDQKCAVVHFNIFQALIYHAAAHSNDPYVCSYTIWIYLFICHIKQNSHYFSFSCQSNTTSKFHIVTMYAIVDSQTKFVHNVYSCLCSTPVPYLHAMLLWFIRHHHQTKSYQAELLPWPQQSYFTLYKNITPKNLHIFWNFIIFQEPKVIGHIVISASQISTSAILLLHIAENWGDLQWYNILNKVS
jgi:hypothetical protein